MTSTPKQTCAAPVDREQRAAEVFLKRHAEQSNASKVDATSEPTSDPVDRDAMLRVARAWRAVGQHAAEPELMVLREQALARARRAHARRWLRPLGLDSRARLVAAAIAGIAVTAAVAWQLSSRGIVPGVYRTGIGEQRTVELDDGSRIALDARTRLRVKYSRDARVIDLAEGQAQFFVARDPGRPFEVRAGEHAIVAVGTVFTVEYVDREVRVAMLEGRVEVALASASLTTTGAASEEDGRSARAALPVSGGATLLSAGEELLVSAEGLATVRSNVDLRAAVAWRQGKVVFHDEPLGEAVRRLNRYSRLQLQIDDPSLRDLRVSGVFEASDARAFVQAVEAYLPVSADYSERDVVRLTPVR